MSKERKKKDRDRDNSKSKMKKEEQAAIIRTEYLDRNLDWEIFETKIRNSMRDLMVPY